MPINPAYICTPVDVGIKENQMMISLNQKNFNNAMMVCKTVKIFIKCGTSCCLMLEWMGGRYIKFLRLGYISFVIQTLKVVWIHLSVDIHALIGDFLLENNGVWHLFLTIYSDEHLSKSISVFQGSTFYSLFLEGFQFLRLSRGAHLF